MSNTQAPRAWWIGLLLLAATTGTLRAQPPELAPQPAIPPFRRIFVPADAIKNRVWTERYLPVDSREFEKLLETVHASQTGAPGADVAHVEKVQWHARLAEDDLLTGTLDVQLQRNSATQGLLAFDPCTAAISAAAWQDANGKPAVLGAGPDARFRILVEGTKLHASWSLRGERTSSGAVNFQLEFPACSIATLTLDAREGLEVSSDKGIITAAAVTPQGRQWTVELGAHNRVNLRVVPEGTARDRRPLTLLRQSLTYEFSSRGVNVGAQLNLDIHGEPIQRIGVDLDPTLRLVAARYGEVEVPWSATEDVESRVSHVVLQLPEPIVGTGRVLRLSALAPIAVGKHWRLPGLKPEAMAWQEGTAALVVPTTLLLEQLITEGCRQSRVATLPAPAAGESVEIQYYRPGATIDVLLSEPRERVKVDRGATVEIGADRITSRAVVQFSVARGQRRNVTADVHPGWTIDAVENRAGGAVDWEVDESDAKGAELKVRLEGPLVPNGSARLVVHGHRARPAAGAFDARNLSMLDFRDSAQGIRLLSITAGEGYELRLSGVEELSRSESVELTTAEAQLFAQPPQGAVLVDDATLAQVNVTALRRNPTFTADVRIDALVQRDNLTETYTIQCTPESARIERLLVHLSQPRDTAPEWSLAGATAGQFSARKLSAAEQAQSGLPGGGESWELGLHLARTGSFEVRGIRTVDFAAELPLSLASVAEATTQRGTLTIRALGDSSLAIKNRRLVSAPAELLESDRYQSVRGTFHYQPGHEELGTETAISIAPTEPVQAESGAWVWRQRLESRFGLDGTTLHCATFYVQTAGRQRLRLSLPLGGRLHETWLESQRLTLAEAAPDETGWPIDLPGGRSFATLTVYYSTPDELPGLSGTYLPRFAHLDIPTMQHQWRAWLLPGYAIFDAPLQPGGWTQEASWTERLFGALARRSGATIFNPLAGRDWRQLFNSGLAAPHARLAGEEFLRELGTAVEEQLGGEELTWGQLLATCAQRQTRRTIWVDADSLRSVGATPQTRVVVSERASDRGTGVLKQANLVLVVLDDSVLLTSALAAAALNAQLVPLDNHVLYTAGPGPLASELQGVNLAGRSAHFATFDAWRNMTEQLGPQDPSSEQGLLHVAAARGWTSRSFDISDVGAFRLRIVRVATLRAIACAVFLAAVGAGFSLAWRKPAVLVLWVAIAAFGSLVLPTAYLPLANALSLAALFCLVLRIIRMPKTVVATPGSPPKAITSRSSVVRPSTMLLFVALSIHAAAALQAAQDVQNPQNDKPREAAASATPQKSPPTADTQAPANADKPETGTASPEVYRVYVPSGVSPSADAKCYVPERLYNLLSRQAASVSGAPQGWLVTNAIYQGALARDPATRQLGLSSLKVNFDLVVFDATLPVRLSFPREGTVNPTVSARLDGRSVGVIWNATNDELVLDRLAAGQYRLELVLRASLQSDLTSAGFDLPIPPLVSAQLELTFPQDSPTIELPMAHGQIRVNRDRGQLSADLGACNRLAVRWPAGIGTEGAAANLEVEELIWIRVRPGTTILDAKFKYHLIAGRMSRVRLLADPRLRLLPTNTANSPVTAVHTVPGNPQRIDLELSRSMSDQVVIELSFLLTGTSGVGNLRLPRLEASGVRPIKRWLAVSVDPALQSQQDGEDAKPLDVGEFAAAWGAGDARPQAAYSIPRGETLWTLATQPNDPQISVEQTLSMSIGRSVSTVHYDAALSIAHGYVFQFGLQAPPTLTIENVSVLEDNVQRVARWTSDESGRITVFLSAPLKGRQSLNLQGRLENPDPEQLTVPQIRFQGDDLKVSRLQLYRQPAVLIDLPPTQGVVAGETTEGDARKNLGALVGCYTIEDPQVPIEVHLRPNAYKAKAATVTHLLRDADRWMAEVECHFEVSDGLADSLQFEIPPQWSEPYRLEPPLSFKIVPVPGEQRRRMVVYPLQPIQGQFELKLRGRVALFAGDRLSVPEILPLRVEPLERFVVLPQFLDLQQVTWDTLGLTRASLPANFVTRAGSASSTTVYQVEGQRFQASLKAVQRTAAAARVALADVHVTWQLDGNCQGVAHFDMLPGGANSIVLRLPAEGRLLHATVEGVPAQAVELGEGRWRLGLGPQQLPQRLEVVYMGPFVRNGDNRRFWCPQLLDVEVDRTLWTLHNPSGLGLGRSQDSTPLIAPAQQELDRLKSMIALVQLPADVVGEHQAEELGRWYRPWRKRYAESRSAIALELAGMRNDAKPSDLAEEVAELDRQIAAIDAQMGGSTLETRFWNPRLDAVDQIATLLPSTAPVAHYQMRGAVYDLDMRFPLAPLEDRTGRWAAGLVMLAMGIAVGCSLWNKTLPTLAPWWVLSTVGVLWWLVLAPSVVGLLALVAAVWLAVRDLWQPVARSTTR